MLGGVIDQEHDVLHYSIGGHLPMPVLYTGEGATISEGRVAGRVVRRATYQDFELKLPETFSLTLLSDGILDLCPARHSKKKSPRCPV